MTNTTTLVRGWKLTRRDGTIMGFTDCDVDVNVDGVIYHASAALAPSEAVSSLGLAVDEQEVQGAVTSSAISEADLAAGLYDGASVEAIEIDWATNTRTATIGVYYLGEVARTEASFTAELRSEAGLLSQVRGRHVLDTCDAELGDARCGVNTTLLAGEGTIADQTGDADFRVTGLDSFNADTFTGGRLVWVSGANLGQTQDLRSQNGEGIGLWRVPLYPVAAGDRFQVFPGCDKSFATCRARFGNGDNFRGFPFVVGEEAFSYATTGDPSLNGGSRNVT